MKAVDFIPIGLAIVCYMLAGIFKDTQVIMIPLVGLGGMLTGVAFPQVSAYQQARQAQRTNSQTGCTRVSIMVIFLVTAVATYVALIFNPPKAHAEEWQSLGSGVWKKGPWVAHPNFTLSAGQINVKDAIKYGAFSEEALERVALAGGYGLTYHGEKLTTGAGLYFGTGISRKTPNAPQVDLLFTFWDALATGPGVQRVTFPSGTVAYQMLWTIGLNYAAGGTVSKVAPWFDRLLNACVAGAACAL